MAPETPGKKGIKSAYERALERMESEGIERPREEAFSPEVLAGMDEARKRAEAKLAELEIMHKGRLRTLREPGGVRQRGEGVPGRAQAHRGTTRA